MYSLLGEVLMNNPGIRREDIIEAIELNDYDILIKFRNGDKIIFDTFTHRRRFIEYDEELTDEELAYEFKLRLRSIMKRRFINQTELANRVGVTQSMISNYMRGTTIPDAIMLKKLAIALNCSTEDFYYKHY